MRQSNSKKKAFGLVEIIVALAIFGTAMIATIAIAIGSLRTVQDNELADTANSVMIGSMEYMKSPAVVPVLNGLPSGQREFAFRVEGDVDPASCFGSECNLNIVRTNTVSEITECDEGSEYRVRLEELPNFLMCNQILVTQERPGVFELRSIVVFFSSNRSGTQRTELIGYRNTAGGVT